MTRPRYDLMSDPVYAREVYDYHLNYRPVRFLARQAYRGLYVGMQPEITYSPDTADMLAQLIHEDAPLLLTLNHLSDLHDQWTAAAIAHRIMPQKVGDIRVIAKDGFYNQKLLQKQKVPKPFRPIVQPVMTIAVNHLGTVPAARSKDHPDTRLRDTSTILFDTATTFTQTGRPVALYPEGTHNYAHPETNLPLQRGIGEIAIRSLLPGNTPASIVPIGVSYGRDYRDIGGGLSKPNHVRHAAVHIGHIATVEQGMTVDDIVALTAHNLQAATDSAFDAYDRRGDA